MFLYVVHKAVVEFKGVCMPWAPVLQLKCGEMQALQDVVSCAVLRGCGLQLEGVSRQRIVPAKMSHSRVSHLAPLFPLSPDIGWHLCTCLQWTCTHAGLCLYVCVGMCGVSQNYHDLVWSVASNNVRSQLVAEAKVHEVLCTCHE